MLMRLSVGLLKGVNYRQRKSREVLFNIGEGLRVVVVECRVSCVEVFDFFDVHRSAPSLTVIVNKLDVGPVLTRQPRPSMLT